MTMSHPEYSEYATCTVCGLKKYCRLIGNYFMCYACDHGNFNGIRKLKKETRK